MWRLSFRKVIITHTELAKTQIITAQFWILLAGAIKGIMEVELPVTQR